MCSVACPLTLMRYDGMTESWVKPVDMTQGMIWNDRLASINLAQKGMNEGNRSGHGGNMVRQ
jgi:hypothetical protein